MSTEKLPAKIANLLETAPEFRTKLSATDYMWLAEVRAAVQATGDKANAQLLQSGIDSLRFMIGGVVFSTGRPQVMQALSNALADLKLHDASGDTSAFVAAGSSFDALVAVGRVFGTAKRSLMIVDPYAGTTLLTDFAPQAPDSVALQVLADARTVKPGLKPAAERWRAQHGATRALDIRLSSAGSLHDRLVIVDSDTVWQTGQSFEHFATRSPTSLVRLEGDLAALKRATYGDFWANATPL